VPDATWHLNRIRLIFVGCRLRVSRDCYEIEPSACTAAAAAAVSISTVSSAAATTVSTTAAVSTTAKDSFHARRLGLNGPTDGCATPSHSLCAGAGLRRQVFPSVPEAIFSEWKYQMHAVACLTAFPGMNHSTTTASVGAGAVEGGVR
jgi:hypothetical protein